MTIDSFEADLMCGRCGGHINGYAAASRQGTTVFYCRPLTERDPDCFSLSSRAGFPELPGEVAPSRRSAPGVYEIAYLQEQASAAFKRTDFNKPGSGIAPNDPDVRYELHS